MTTTLIWQCNPESSWERDWIELLFQRVPHTTIKDTELTTKRENSVLIYNSTVNNDEYIKDLHSKGMSFGLIHLSDEWYRDSIDNYSLAKFVIRNFCGNYAPNVHVFPVGCITGYPYNIPSKPSHERQYTWSFSGHTDKSTRPQMVEHMSTVPNGKYYFKSCGEYEGYSLNPMQMWEMYNDSVFVPCPKGNSVMESFRLCEALQAGSLPIVERSDYWTQLYGEHHPLIEIDDWSEAPALISSLINDSDALELRRLRTYSWWNTHCDKLLDKVKEIV